MYSMNNKGKQFYDKHKDRLRKESLERYYEKKLKNPTWHNKVKLTDMMGQRIGKLTVLNREPNGKFGSARWKCLCDCGNITIVYSHALRSTTKSCGCLNTSMRKNTHPLEWLYKRLTNKCKHTNKQVSLTFNDFLEFTKTNECHYCGCKIEWRKRKPGVYQSVRYNLDRKNNEVGYTIGNCVVCCLDCNYTKADRFTYDEMLLIGKTIGEVKQSRQI